MEVSISLKGNFSTASLINICGGPSVIWPNLEVAVIRITLIFCPDERSKVKKNRKKRMAAETRTLFPAPIVSSTEHRRTKVRR